VMRTRLFVTVAIPFSVVVSFLTRAIRDWSCPLAGAGVQLELDSAWASSIASLYTSTYRLA